MSQQFFYDAQIRRFLLQFTRIFSGFEVEYGKDNEGVTGLYRVPVRYGDASRQAQTVLQNNSANSLPSTPLMTFYVTNLNYARDRIQEPYHVEKTSVRQRVWDTETQSYETTQGNAFTIERLMPVPYNLEVQLDIWTSNTNQKLQIMEQILTLFNPALEIQSTDNFLDWTSLSVVELQSSTWTSRSIPVGTDDPIDIASLRFSMPIWISSPAKVKKLGVVQKIIASIYDAHGNYNEAIFDNDLLLGTRQKFTPYNYQVLLLGNQLQILQPSAVVENNSGFNVPTSLPPSPTTSLWNTVVALYEELGAQLQVLVENNVDSLWDPYDELGTQITSLLPQAVVESLSTEDVPSSPTSNLKWHTVIDLYGELRNGISQVRLDNPYDETIIVGTVAFHPSDDRFLLFTVDEDTIPANTLSPITAIVDPLRKGPNAGLPASSLGQRYLFVETTGSDDEGDAAAWRGTDGSPLFAQTNDIVEYDGTRWNVVFDSSNLSSVQYVTNLTTGIQYRWAGSQWLKSYEGLYPEGEWSFVP